MTPVLVTSFHLVATSRSSSGEPIKTLFDDILGRIRVSQKFGTQRELYKKA